MLPDELPDGLYDLLLDRGLMEAIEPLRALGAAEVRQVLVPERRARLIKALAQVLAEVLDDREFGKTESGYDDPLIGLFNKLLSVTHHSVGKSDGLAGWVSPPQVLQSIHRRGNVIEHPRTGLLSPWLFTAGRGDPALLAELRTELAAADRVDILMSFITWSGVRRLLDVFEAATAVGSNGQPKTLFRIITTTYIGATELQAVEKLATLPGVQVRISLDGRRTRLHAKAWIFHRATGFGSAYVGSANMTGAALIGGLEWTVKFTQAGQSDLFAAAEAHFETLWNDPEFEQFDPNQISHRERLQAALRQEAGGAGNVITTWFDLQPKTYQQAMLDRLSAERRHGRMRNLLVAATGTGKTMVAAFDYQRTIREHGGGLPRLLFVAHRIELLRQARDTYRQVLKRPDFGELFVEGHVPGSYDHLFASIQRVTSSNLLARVGVDYWHSVVIDECHHLPASTFDQFARKIAPSILLGLTATPERSDGDTVLSYFDARPDGSPAVELRLWDALDQQLLAPFEYFGTGDETDLSNVPWDRRGLEIQALDNLISANSIRAKLVIDTVRSYCGRMDQVRALAFCVSVRHAEFMAGEFNRRGIMSEAVTGQTAPEIREKIPTRLAEGKIQIVCTCDLYNEGVDIPEINTLLLLRPTQSPVLFQQQLGRGLRLTSTKSNCLVLDFVGRYREEFRIDRILQAITGVPRTKLAEEVTQGFPSLPPGCHIRFDRVARERVLANLQHVINQTWPRLKTELRAFSAVEGRRDFTMMEFIRKQGIELDDIYRSAGESGWTALRRATGFEINEPGPDEQYLGRRFSDLLHADDPAYLNVWKQFCADGEGMLASTTDVNRRRIQMLAYQIYAQHKHAIGPEKFAANLRENPLMKSELAALAELLDDATTLEARPIPNTPESWPLSLHAAYQQREILTAVGWLRADRRVPFQAGCLAIPEHKTELLFVTLDKSEGYHERIAYRDYAISPELFHWQTQNSAGPNTMAGKRYLESPINGWQFQLFVREDKSHPYRALGPVVLEKWEGNRPMSITWRLGEMLPIELFKKYSVLRSI
jgi:superfamily II DNA or RNA helicase/HKD family nuclease